MNEKFSISADIPSKILDIVVDSLYRVGIKLPPFLLQCFLFVLTLTALTLVIRKLVKDFRAGEKKKAKNPMLILTATGLSLILFGIVFSWGEQVIFPLPDEIRGQIELAGGSGATSYQGFKVYVLGFENKKLGEGRVDTRNGRFGVYWKSSFGLRPQGLKVEAPGCKDKIEALEYHVIRKSDVVIRFECDRSS
jgi:hypothetical protein